MVMMREEGSSQGGDSVRVRDLLDVPSLGLRLLTDVSGAFAMEELKHTTAIPLPPH